MRRGSGDGTKATLVEAAISLFSERGFATTTVQEIVERAEVTKGAFYHHFGTKEDVLFHIYEVFVTEHLEAAEAVMASELSPSDTLVRLMEETARTVAMFRKYTAIIVGELRLLNDERLNSGRFGELNAKQARIIEFWVQTIERGITTGEFTAPVPDTRALAFALLGMPLFTYAWLDTTTPISGVDVGHQFGALALSGLQTVRTRLEQNGRRTRPAEPKAARATARTGK